MVKKKKKEVEKEKKSDKEIQAEVDAENEQAARELAEPEIPEVVLAKCKEFFDRELARYQSQIILKDIEISGLEAQLAKFKAPVSA